ncbi:MAG: vanadium-dependent haloperoxidase [Saprospiraceae bacterium]|nr:vanadium-dependent haloperoxidase [Saprospiraceae bacterium]
MKKLLLFKWLFVMAISVMVISSCQKSENEATTGTELSTYESDVYHEWTNVFLNLDRYASFFRPGPAPRALAYMNLSAYEACLGGLPEYQTLQYRLGIPDMPASQNNLYWPAVINASHAYLMNKFFETVTFKDKDGNILNKQEMLNTIQAKENELKAYYRRETSDQTLLNSEAHGQEVAAAIWRFSISDVVGHNAHLNPFPVPVSATGCQWIPTDPLTVADRGLYSQWGQVRRFGLDRDDLDALIAPFNCDPEPNSAMYLQAYECYTLTNLARFDPRGENEHMAEFWSDDRVGWTFSPPARLVAIADQIVQKENFELDKTCVLYAQISMALNDAAVIAWYNKYKYNIERPITYIHRNIDAKFSIPWLGFTPPFPAYPSGHSTFAFSGVGILEAFVGSSYPFTDNCHANRTDFNGRARSYNSLRDLANENAYSRLPLGVHFRMDYESGNFCGILAARKVLLLPWKN